jgi:chromosomal replication initiation ATPase DnaA
MLASAQEALDGKYALAPQGSGFSHIISAVTKLMSISPKDLIGPCKELTIIKARVLGCYPAVSELGMLVTEIGNKIGTSVSTVSYTVKKGQHFVERKGLKLLDLIDLEI